MTLTQLEAFVLVARLGSVTAAARTLGVTEPAVSGALAALRQQLGDPLIRRAAGGMMLTPGGRRVVGIASQMVALGAEAEAAIRQAQGAPEQLRLVASSAIAESLGPSLVSAFSARPRSVDVTLGVAGTGEIPALLHERLADVALGPKLSGEAAAGLDTMPLFRYRLVFVADPSHRLARAGSLGPADLGEATWLVGPDATDEGSPVHRLLGRLAVPERRIRVFSSHAGALAATAEGRGVAPAVAHLVSSEVDRGSLVVLPVEGTPLDLLWHATTLRSERRSPATDAFRRFLATPDATQAMHAPGGGVAPSRFRPPVYVTIWS